MSGKLIWQRSHKGTMNDRNKAFAHYKRHVEDMKVVVLPDQLLVYSVQQGWGSLCEFLGVPVPVSKFPNVNDRPGIMKTIHEITRGAYVILGAGLVGFAGLAYGALRFFSWITDAVKAVLLEGASQIKT